MLNQNERSPLPVAVQVVQVFAGTNGYLDRIDADRVEEFLEALEARLKAEAGDLLEKIAGGDWSDETQSAVDAVVSEFAADFGYDLDEEGHAVEAGDSDRVVTRQAAGSDNGSDAEVPVEAAAGAAAL